MTVTILIDNDFPLRTNWAITYYIDRRMTSCSWIKRFFRNQASSIGVSRQEIEANSFAAGLLMPRRLLAVRLPKDNEIEINVYDVCDLFQVSEHAMTIRLIKLGFMTSH